MYDHNYPVVSSNIGIVPECTVVPMSARQLKMNAWLARWLIKSPFSYIFVSSGSLSCFYDDTIVHCSRYTICLFALANSIPSPLWLVRWMLACRSSFRAQHTHHDGFSLGYYSVLSCSIVLTSFLTLPHAVHVRLLFLSPHWRQFYAHCTGNWWSRPVTNEKKNKQKIRR